MAKEILKICLYVFTVFGTISIHAQCGLQSGPMNGHSAMLEVTVWVQTKCDQEVQMRYWVEGKEEEAWFSNPIMTEQESGYTAHLKADQVKPGKIYAYDIWIDGSLVRLSFTPKFQTQPLWQWREDPPGFSFAAGSCAYITETEYDRPREAYGGDYKIFEMIQNEQPDFMIWLGDNTYLREVDWNSKTGIYHRYTHTRSLPQLQQLLGTSHHYAIWDDHDYGPNDSDRSYWGKDITREAFTDFWANPLVGVGNSEGITGYFQWADCDFFLMDNRWYRGPRDQDESYFGEIQVQWLVDVLRYSKAPYKFICTGGQVVSNAAVFENYENYSREKQVLIDQLDRYNIGGVVFLTGDRHHSEISTYTTRDGDIFYDITSSALTSRTSAHPEERNTYRVPGSMIGVRNYAVINVMGERTNRKCEVVFKDVDGNELFRHEIRR